MRALIFTVVVTIISKLIRWHDRVYAGIDVSAPIAGPGFSRHRLASGRNMLDAVLCEPAADHPAQHAVLICHGIGETVEYWTDAQRVLASKGVASLIFNYSGYGRSTGWISAAQCERDAIAAFAFLKSRASQDCAISLIGFSMGTGVAAAIAPGLEPSLLMLCAGFTNFHDAAIAIGWPKMLAWMSPEIWDTCAALSSSRTPVLVVHGERDDLFPCAMAEAVVSACASPCELVIVPELGHNAPLFSAVDWYWKTIADAVSNPDEKKGRSLPRERP